MLDYICCERSTISDTFVLRPWILHYLTLIIQTIFGCTPNLVVSSTDHVTSVAETASTQIPVIRIFIRIAHRWWTASDIFLCFLRLIIFSNLQRQRFVGRRRPFGTPLPTRRCHTISPCSSIGTTSNINSITVSLAIARSVIANTYCIFDLYKSQIYYKCSQKPMQPIVSALLIFESFPNLLKRLSWCQVEQDCCGNNSPEAPASFPEFFLREHISVTWIPIGLRVIDRISR